MSGKIKNIMAHKTLIPRIPLIPYIETQVPEFMNNFPKISAYQQRIMEVDRNIEMSDNERFKNLLYTTNGQIDFYEILNGYENLTFDAYTFINIERLQMAHNRSKFMDQLRSRESEQQETHEYDYSYKNSYIEKTVKTDENTIDCLKSIVCDIKESNITPFIFNLIETISLSNYYEIVSFIFALSNESYHKIAKNMKDKLFNHKFMLNEDTQKEICSIYIRSLTKTDYDSARDLDLINYKLIDMHKCNTSYNLKDIGQINIPLCVYFLLKNSIHSESFKTLTLTTCNLTVLHMVIAENKYFTFSSFMQLNHYNPSDLNKKDALGNTPLSMALAQNKLDFAKILIDCNSCDLCVSGIPYKLYKRYTESISTVVEDVSEPLFESKTPHPYSRIHNYAPFNAGTQHGLRCDYPIIGASFLLDEPTLKPCMLPVKTEDHMYLINAFKCAIKSESFKYDKNLAEFMITSSYVNSELFIAMAQKSKCENDTERLLDLFEENEQYYDTETSYINYLRCNELNEIKAYLESPSTKTSWW